MGSTGWIFPFKVPVDLECSWVEGLATGRDPGWPGLRSLRSGSSTSRLRSVCHCWPKACRCSVHNDLCVATTCADGGRQGVGEKRAQLNTWAGSGEHCPRGLTSPIPLGPTEIAPSLPPAGPSAPLGTPQQALGAAFKVGSWAKVSHSGPCSGSELSVHVRGEGHGPVGPCPLGDPVPHMADTPTHGSGTWTCPTG